MKRRLGLFCGFSVLCAAYGDSLATADYLTAFEQDVVREHNLARTKPQQYIAFLEAYARGFSGNIYIAQDGTRIRTNEGVKAVEEAIAFLRTVRSVGPLKPALGMSAGAATHAAEQAQTGKTGHEGRDGRQHGERVNRYGEWQSRSGENIQYGDGSPRDVVMRLIVDDGVPSRGHRTNIFDDRFQVIGVGCDDHPTFRRSCVLTYAAGYKDRMSAGKAARAANTESSEPQSTSRSTAKASLRMWTDTKGRRLQGTLHSVDSDNVRLKTPEGRVITVPRKMLSQPDLDHLRSLR